MKSKYLVLLIVLMMLTGFSGIQRQGAIAVDVALLLPGQINEACAGLNGPSDHATQYPDFNDGVFVPHISLFQCYIKAGDTAKLLAALQPVEDFLAHNPLTLKINRITYDKNTRFFFYEIQKGGADYTALKMLQYWVHSISVAYVPGPGFVPDGACFADGNTNKFDLDYVAGFHLYHSLEKYWPHITLGMSNMDVAGPVSIDPFLVSRAGVFWLSANGTVDTDKEIGKAGHLR